MLKLKIVEKSKYEYKLEDEKNNKYTIKMEFLDIVYDFQIGDIFYINKELLNPKYEGYSISYTFGNLDNPYGKENIPIDDIDVIKIVKDNKEIYLKRLYG